MALLPLPRNYEALSAAGDLVEEGQILAVSWPRGEGPDVVAPFAGVLIRREDGFDISRNEDIDYEPSPVG